MIIMAGLLNLVHVPHTSPHLTSFHLTSPHLTSPHLTSPHLTSPHLTSDWGSQNSYLTCTPDEQLSNAVGNADAEKQAAGLREQLSKAEAHNAAEVQGLQQAESSLRDDLKQARLDIEQVLICSCSLTLSQLAGKGAVSSCLEVVLLT